MKTSVHTKLRIPNSQKYLELQAHTLKNKVFKIERI